MDDRTKIIIWAVIILLVYALNVNDNLGVTVDHAEYMIFAESLFEGHGYRYINTYTEQPGFSSLPPLYSAFIAPLLVFGMHFFVPKILNILLILVMLWFYYRWLQEKKVLYPLHLTILFALLPFTIFFVVNIQSEILYVALSFLAIYLLDKSAERPRMLWLAALCAYAAYMTRPVGLAAITAVLVYSVILVRRKKHSARHTALVIGTLIAVLVATHVFIAWYDPTPSAAWSRLLLKDNYRPELGYVTAGDLLLRIPSNFFGYLGFSLARDTQRIGMDGFGIILPVYIALNLIVIALCIVGIFRSKKTSSAAWYLLFYLPILLLFVWTSYRYLYPLFPFLLFYLMNGTETILQRWKRQALTSLRYILSVGIGLCVIFSCYLIYYHHGHDYTPEWNGLEETSRWAGENLQGAKIMAQNCDFFYLHSGLKCTPMNLEMNVESIESQIREGGYTHVVVTSVATTKLLVTGTDPRAAFREHFAQSRFYQLVHENQGTFVYAAH